MILEWCSIWKEVDGSYWCRVRWYTIPEETAAGRQPHNLRREIYRTNDFANIEVIDDISSLSFIKLLCKCYVLLLSPNIQRPYSVLINFSMIWLKITICSCNCCQNISSIYNLSTLFTIWAVMVVGLEIQPCQIIKSSWAVPRKCLRKTKEIPAVFWGMNSVNVIKRGRFPVLFPHPLFSCLLQVILDFLFTME